MSTQVSFSTFDILTDDEVRQGLKTFSNWPTYPQVYVKVSLHFFLELKRVSQELGIAVLQECSKIHIIQIFFQGELVGGLDIVKELVEAGDLVPTLKGEA